MDVDDVKTIDCGEEFVIANVDEYKSNIEKAMSSCKKIVIDASKVERTDTAALQLLFALYKHAVAGDFLLEIKQPSELFCTAARELGLGEILV